MLIIDAQSVKNTDPAEEKGYDRGKKISGIKRHLAVDTQSLPHLLGVTTANMSCHWVLDVGFGEDLRQVRDLKAARNLSILPA